MADTTDCFVYFFLLLRISVAQGEYFVSEEHSHWSSEDKRCTFAKPPIQFSEGKVLTDISNLNVNKNDKIWAGYFRKETGFEYLGCASFANAIILQSAGPSGSPGICQTMCKKNGIIGVSQNECYCLNDSSIASINTRVPKCDKECKYQEGVACGGKDKDIFYTSLYRSNNNVTRITTMSSMDACLALEPTIRSFIWGKCPTKFQVMCSDGKTVWKVERSFKEWTKATTYCLSMDSRPTQYSDPQPRKDSSASPLWTGMIKSRVIYTFDGTYDNRTKIEYGYVEYNNRDNRYELKFGLYDTEQKYLCYREQEVEVSSASSINMTSGITFITDQTDEDNQDLSAIVSASVVSVLIVVAAAVGIVILRRRNLIPSLCKIKSTKEEYKEEQPNSTNYQMSQENNAFDQAGTEGKNGVNKSDNHYTHTYFVLEANESNTDSTYDTSGNNESTFPDNFNVYNKLELDQTYDDAHTNNKTAVAKSDDTYDTTEKAAKKLKASSGRKSDITDETDEDAYNHITSKPVKNAKTENDYAVINTPEDAYGDVVAQNKNNNDEGDTYNHINNIS